MCAAPEWGAGVSLSSLEFVRSLEPWQTPPIPAILPKDTHPLPGRPRVTNGFDGLSKVPCLLFIEILEMQARWEQQSIHNPISLTLKRYAEICSTMAECCFEILRQRYQMEHNVDVIRYMFLKVIWRWERRWLTYPPRHIDVWTVKWCRMRPMLCKRSQGYTSPVWKVADYHRASPWFNAGFSAWFVPYGHVQEMVCRRISKTSGMYNGT